MPTGKRGVSPRFNHSVTSVLDIGVSAAAYEQQQSDAQQTMQDLSLASSYLSLAKSEAWQDIKAGLTQLVNEAELAIIESRPGESLEQKRDTFVRYQEWKKIRIFLETRVEEKSQEFKQYATQEIAQNGNVLAEPRR